MKRTIDVPEQLDRVLDRVELKNRLKNASDSSYRDSDNSIITRKIAWDELEFSRYSIERLSSKKMPSNFRPVFAGKAYWVLIFSFKREGRFDDFRSRRIHDIAFDERAKPLEYPHPSVFKPGTRVQI